MRRSRRPGAEAAALRADMVSRISANGATDGWWMAAMDRAAHAFLPDTVWEQRRDPSTLDDLFPVERADDPDRWLRGAYEARPVLTQVDDCRLAVHGPAGRDDGRARPDRLTPGASCPP